MSIITKLKKSERQRLLIQKLDEDPFTTDEDLAKLFVVSVQTVRLDRMELGIPELRERIKNVAEKQLDAVRSLPIEEVIGEIIDLKLDHSAISLLEVKEEHVFSRNNIARGHIIFAQANSLAIAVMNEEVALTMLASVRFIQPVKLHDRLIAKAEVIAVEGEKGKVEVNTYVKDHHVFSAQFTIYRKHHLV